MSVIEPGHIVARLFFYPSVDGGEATALTRREDLDHGPQACERIEAKYQD